MTTETINYFTHGSGGGLRQHEWQYLGRKAQAYRCNVCLLKVTKMELKANTDA